MLITIGIIVYLQIGYILTRLGFSVGRILLNDAMEDEAIDVIFNTVLWGPGLVFVLAKLAVSTIVKAPWWVYNKLFHKI